MKILIDMNLSPLLAEILKDKGVEAIHWASVGDPKAADHEILEWAKENKYIILTHDLDFCAILAATNANFPSVLQIRTQNVSPDHIFPIILFTLSQYKDLLESGVIISIDERRSRVHILPLGFTSPSIEPYSK